MISALMEQGRQINGGFMPKCSITSTNHTIKMTVENVSKMQLERKVVSPDSYLTLECMCRISFMKSQKWLFVYICNKSDMEIKMGRTIYIYDCNLKKLFELSDAKIFSLQKDEEVDVIGNIEVSKIKMPLPNDMLIIYLCASIKNIVKDASRLKCDIDPQIRLKEDFKTMLENPINSDVFLEVGKEKIPAHWSVLCSRSPFFKRMFDSGMKESVQNTITITDTSLETVKKLIRFLYTADFVHENDIQEVLDLYSAADRYEVTDLRTLCGHKLISNAKVDTVAEILLLSLFHNDKTLKEEAIDFIRLHSDAVFQTESWKRFEEREAIMAETIVLCFRKNKCVGSC